MEQSEFGNQLFTDIQQHFPTLQLNIENAEPFHKVKFPFKENADYQFSIDLHEEPVLYAELISMKSLDYHFWYRPFELAEFKQEGQELKKCLLETLALILSHDTRIIQARRLLFWSFQLEYKLPSDWKYLYGLDALKGSFHVPVIEGKTKIYFAPSIF
jgi:hypothetical protein